MKYTGILIGLHVYFAFAAPIQEHTLGKLPQYTHKIYGQHSAASDTQQPQGRSHDKPKDKLYVQRRDTPSETSSSPELGNDVEDAARPTHASDEDGVQSADATLARRDFIDFLAWSPWRSLSDKRRMKKFAKLVANEERLQAEKLIREEEKLEEKKLREKIFQAKKHVERREEDEDVAATDDETEADAEDQADAEVTDAALQRRGAGLNAALLGVGGMAAFAGIVSWAMHSIRKDDKQLKQTAKDQVAQSLSDDKKDPSSHFGVKSTHDEEGAGAEATSPADAAPTDYAADGEGVFEKRNADEDASGTQDPDESGIETTHPKLHRRLAGYYDLMVPAGLLFVGAALAVPWWLKKKAKQRKEHNKGVDSELEKLKDEEKDWRDNLRARDEEDDPQLVRLSDALGGDDEDGVELAIEKRFFTDEEIAARELGIGGIDGLPRIPSNDSSKNPHDQSAVSADEEADGKVLEKRILGITTPMVICALIAVLIITPFVTNKIKWDSQKRAVSADEQTDDEASIEDEDLKLVLAKPLIESEGEDASDDGLVRRHGTPHANPAVLAAFGVAMAIFLGTTLAVGIKRKRKHKKEEHEGVSKRQSRDGQEDADEEDEEDDDHFPLLFVYNPKDKLEGASDVGSVDQADFREEYENDDDHLPLLFVYDPQDKHVGDLAVRSIDQEDFDEEYEGFDDHPPLLFVYDPQDKHIGDLAVRSVDREDFDEETESDDDRLPLLFVYDPLDKHVRDLAARSIDQEDFDEGYQSNDDPLLVVYDPKDKNVEGGATTGKKLERRFGPLLVGCAMGLAAVAGICMIPLFTSKRLKQFKKLKKHEKEWMDAKKGDEKVSAKEQSELMGNIRDTLHDIGRRDEGEDEDEVEVDVASAFADTEDDDDDEHDHDGLEKRFSGMGWSALVPVAVGAVAAGGAVGLAWGTRAWKAYKRRKAWRDKWGKVDKNPGEVGE